MVQWTVLVMGSSGNNVISWVVVVMAALSLFSMMCMLQIDRVVRMDLYSYGLRFTDQWTLPYSNMAKLVFLFGWMNIAAAISVHMYALAFKRGEVRQLVTAVEEELSKKEISIPAGEKPICEEAAGEKLVSEVTVKETTAEATASGGTLTKLFVEEHADQRDTADEKTIDETIAKETAEENTDEKGAAEETTVEENPPVPPVQEEEPPVF